MATVIKSNSPHVQSAERSLHAVAFSFEDMADQADGYLDSVRNEAAKIVQEAHQEAEKVRREAAESGRQAARDAAHAVLDEKVGKQMGSLIPVLQKAVRDIEDTKHDWLAHWERSTVSLAAAIASRIVRQELQSQPEIAAGLIREALSLAAGAERITLHLSVTDHQILKGQVEKLTDSLSQLAPAQIVADDAIDPGGCRVVTEFGEVDQRIESQLQRIVEELTG